MPKLISSPMVYEGHGANESKLTQNDFERDAVALHGFLTSKIPNATLRKLINRIVKTEGAYFLAVGQKVMHCDGGVIVFGNPKVTITDGEVVVRA